MRRILGIVLVSWCLTGGAGGDVADNIKQVKAEHEQQLLDLPGVVSIGIGLDSNGNQAIIVGLEKADSQITQKIPTELDGYAVIVRQVGTIEAQ
jgi:hypothetical protein